MIHIRTVTSRTRYQNTWMNRPLSIIRKVHQSPPANLPHKGDPQHPRQALGSRRLLGRPNRANVCRDRQDVRLASNNAGSMDNNGSVQEIKEGLRRETLRSRTPSTPQEQHRAIEQQQSGTLGAASNTLLFPGVLPFVPPKPSPLIATPHFSSSSRSYISTTPPYQQPKQQEPRTIIAETLPRTEERTTESPVEMSNITIYNPSAKHFINDPADLVLSALKSVTLTNPKVRPLSRFH